MDVPDERIIVGSEGHVHQILINLIQNAYDALEESARKGNRQPRLGIAVRDEDDYLHIEVRDNGTGIAEPDLLRIFDPFFTSKPVGKGTGLGLYISYGLATEQCGGALQVSNHPDGGVLAVLSLPLAESD